MNLVAPDAGAFLPGDLVGITLVIASRPQQLTTPTPAATPVLNPDFVLQPGLTPSAEDAAQAEALTRAHPPLAKDLFPMGVRVMAVQGLPAAPAEEADGSSSAYLAYDQPKMLILLIPNGAREVLSLALQQGDRLVISLMARGDESPTAGFTYWDFEDLFQADRKDALSGDR